MSSVLGRGMARHLTGALLASVVLASSAQAQQPQSDQAGAQQNGQSSTQQSGQSGSQQSNQPSPQQRAAQQQALQQLFLSNPSGGGDLMRAIRDMVISDHTALDAIIDSLSPTCNAPKACANPSQQTAIGNGLGLAAQALLGTDQPFATQIQQALAGAGSNLASVAFAAITGNVAIGAGGGGGGGGGSGGPTGSGPPMGGPNTGFSANASFGTTNFGGGGLTGGTANSVNQLTSPF
jgi:hypothetical protein